jgi:hypothetical protein
VLVTRLSHREDHRDRIGQQSPGRERHGRDGRPIQPLRIVDEADQRALRRHVGQQRQDGQAHEEPVRSRGPVPQAEHGLQRVALWSRKVVEPGEHRRAELVQSGEGDLHLGLDTADPGHVAVEGLLEQVVEQNRLADPGFAAQDEYRAPAIVEVVDQPIQSRALTAPATKHPSGPAAGHGHVKS